MSLVSETIARKINNCSFNLQSIQRFLDLMATQQTQYSDISLKTNGRLSLVLRATRNGIEEVALKVLECTVHTEYQIQSMEREYAICKQLPSSDYIMDIQTQFFLTEAVENTDQSQSCNLNTARKIYFVQQMEMCQGSLQDMMQHCSQSNKDPPTEEFKEILAIQILDAVNILHQRKLPHGNITAYNILVSSSENYPALLKLCNIQSNSSVNLINPMNSTSGKESINCMPSITEIQRDSLEQDLVSLGKIFLELNNIDTNVDYSTIIATQQLNTSTLLYKLACSLLNNSRENNMSARSILLLLLQKQTSIKKIPIFSIVVKSQVDSLCLQVPSKRIMLDFLLWQMNKQSKFNNFPVSLTRWDKGKSCQLWIY